MGEVQESSMWDNLMSGAGSVIVSPVADIYSLMPDSLLFGSLVLYFLTQNLSFGVFAIFIFETVCSHRILSWLFSQSVGPSRSVTDIKCRAGYKTPQFNADRIFSHDQYPSYGVFSITSIATYLGLSTSEFSQTLNEMGSDWKSRTTVAYVFIMLVVSAFVIIRMQSCQDSLGEVIIAMFSAVILGSIWFYVNKSLFGVESINFLGLPYLVSKESQGSPIYVCAPNSST